MENDDRGFRERDTNKDVAGREMGGGWETEKSIDGAEMGTDVPEKEMGTVDRSVKIYKRGMCLEAPAKLDGRDL